MGYFHSHFIIIEPRARNVLTVSTFLKGSRVSVFDPAHSDLERAVLGLLGLEALDTNCEGRFEVHDDPVQLFYLPHCPKQLSNNLLWANWSAEKLQKLVVVGNSFKRILLLPDRVQCIRRSPHYYT